MTNRIATIIAAGGSSTRMGGIDKLFRLVDGIPVIIKTCMAFVENKNISSLVVAIKEENIAKFKELLCDYDIDKYVKVVSGGKTRQESVFNAVNELDECDFILIHDAARPFVSQELINNCVDSALKYGSAVPVLRSVDTLKKVDNSFVEKTLDRDTIYRVQTPQIFKFNDYLHAIKNYFERSDTDDSMMIERSNVKVHTINGEKNNIKLTYEDDFDYAEYLMKGVSMYRSGIGYDVHRLVEDRKLILCGVEIPHKTGLLGHSDADVPVHALMDAILGAAALGDIGKLFPDNDQKYKNANSMYLLKQVVDIVNNEGYTISNIDITIIAQKPKMLPYIDDMRQNLSEVCNCSIDLVSVKATTEEGLGFTGQELAISSLATCTLIK